MKNRFSDLRVFILDPFRRKYVIFYYNYHNFDLNYIEKDGRFMSTSLSNFNNETDAFKMLANNAKIFDSSTEAERYLKSFIREEKINNL